MNRDLILGWLILVGGAGVCFLVLSLSLSVLGRIWPQASLFLDDRGLTNWRAGCPVWGNGK